ncbi:hypothetical protein JCM6882_006130 [Rhodosporidiobolus microsporus]
MQLHALSALFATLVFASSATAAPSHSSSSSPYVKDGAPIVDLGKYGKWKGTVQNNGTVHAWKAIPYAAPPVGDLRFKAPRPLAKQNSTLQDVSADFDGQPTACVQFGDEDWSGPNAGPGGEDCLKLWIWAPAGAKEGDKLPVQVWSHGGGMQNGQSPKSDYSDWVGQDKGFIAVNANYRLGLLGFWNSESSTHENEPGNVGLLDSRFAVDWVKKNIHKFGGDPNNLAISGQSGGGGAIMTQLILYDGKKPNFEKAIPRSIQQYSAYPLKDLTPRNDAFAALVNCTDSAATKEGAKKQLACMRKVPAETIRVVSLQFKETKDDQGFSWPGWLPAIDGKSLTDQPSRLFRSGKIAKVPVLSAHTTNEIVRLIPHPNSNFTRLAETTIGPLVTPELVSELERIYPAPSVNASKDTNTYSNADERGYAIYDDNLSVGGAFMVSTGVAAAGLPSYLARFNSPTGEYPAWMGTPHSADNYYLQNATATMNSTQADLAHEWRAYLSSFMKHNDPNPERLPTSPKWLPASTDFRYLPRMVVSLQLGSSANLSSPTTSGMEITPANEWDRHAWWLSDEVTKLSRQ